MSKAATKIATKTETRVQRPRLHKVILFNDDYTPRDFVVGVLKAVFRLNETQALSVMMTAHRKGVCVVAVLAQDIAETKAARATEAGAAKGYPLRFGTEPEEQRARGLALRKSLDMSGANLPSLKMRKLGRTNVRVTELGLGTAPLGELFDKVEDDEAAAIIGAAWDGGVRYFDTSPWYGRGLAEHSL